ncbi:hypothetical protein C8R42DRAFT_727117 [Lentinula raphanica]|nr:hypothetical protein C8R42DRAFT_727117 [Lentinula raphanica]
MLSSLCFVFCLVLPAHSAPTHDRTAPIHDHTAPITEVTQSKDIVHASFRYPTQQYGGCGTPRAGIKYEHRLIVAKYRKDNNIEGDFDVEYDNRYDNKLSENHHHFWFWGDKMECQTRANACDVRYLQLLPSNPEPETRLASLIVPGTSLSVELPFELRLKTEKKCFATKGQPLP